MRSSGRRRLRRLASQLGAASAASATGPPLYLASVPVFVHYLGQLREILSRVGGRSQLLSATLAQIRQSLVETPRELTIVYMNPLDDENLLAECPWLMPARELPVGRWDSMRFGLYKSRAMEALHEEDAELVATPV